jgi:hypothetical protein
MSKRYFFTSLTRISDLQQQVFDVKSLPRDQWQTGDYVVGEIIAPLTQKPLIEDCHGRMIEVRKGDLIIGALGVRSATLEAVGSWQDIGEDGKMEILTEGGLFGKATSVSIKLGDLAPMIYQGHIVRKGKKVCMKNFLPHFLQEDYNYPTIVIIGTSMSCGKTTISRLLIPLLKKFKLKIAGVKLAGAGQYHDILSMQDAGADIIFDFVNVGLPSTICSATEYETAMNNLLSLVAGAKPDLVVAEVGASPFGPYNGSLALEKITSQICFTIVCANDPYGVLGLINSFNIAPDVISGVVTNNQAGVELVENLTGIKAVCPTDLHAEDKLISILKEKLPLIK